MRFAIICVLSFFLSIVSVYAEGNEVNEEKFIAQNQHKVERAAENDWKTPAECAEALVSKRIWNKIALEWINKSIDIRETVYNRIVKGDFLVLTGKIKEGQKEYIRAIELAKETGNNSEIGHIQWKMLISMGLENYQNYQTQKK